MTMIVTSRTPKQDKETVSVVDADVTFEESLSAGDLVVNFSSGVCK